MTKYVNLGGSSNVLAYEIGFDYIDVIFGGTNLIYRYSYRSAGMQAVETMKRLATSGSGLNSYINRYVRKQYESKMQIKY